VSGDEPGCFEVVLFEELEEAADPDGACEEACCGSLEIEGREEGRGNSTSTYVAGGVFSAVAAKPACYCVDVDSVSDENALLGHCDKLVEDNGDAWR
jgi:hypothetical protein